MGLWRIYYLFMGLFLFKNSYISILCGFFLMSHFSCFLQNQMKWVQNKNSAQHQPFKSYLEKFLSTLTISSTVQEAMGSRMEK
jgi:hypothetical protein